MRRLGTLASWISRLPPGAVVVAACWSIQQLPVLPSPRWGPLASCIGLLLCAACRRADRHADRLVLLVGVALAAAGWALYKADQHLAHRLPPALEGIDLVVRGIVREMPQDTEFGQRFRFRIEACEGSSAGCPAQREVRLSWTRPTSRARSVVEARGAADAPFGVRAGQRWQFTVRLKRPHAPLNPGLFDAELRALEEDVAAHGSVRQSARVDPPRLLDAFVATPGTVFERMREALRARIVAALPDADPAVRGIVVALVVGDQSAIPARWWEVLNRTGIGHLVSISGLHITMLAGLAAAGAGWLWRARAPTRLWGGTPLAHWLPAPQARWLVGVTAAFVYSALAGWGIPAQRTCWMLAVAGAAKLTGRADALPGVLGTAAAVVCVFDPWAPMAAGFWLSFGAVAGIVWFGSVRHRPVFAARRAHADDGALAVPEAPAPSGAPAPPDACRPPVAWVTRAVARGAAAVRPAVVEGLRSQLAASLVLLPMGAVFFSSLSLVGPLANLVAIPLVSGLVTPLALAGAALSVLWAAGGDVVLSAAAWLTARVLQCMVWLDHEGAGAVALASPTPGALALAIAGCVLLLAPLRVPARGLALFAFVPILTTHPPTLPPGAVRITALDVGQGMALLVETQEGRLLYDTGPRFGTENDAGARLVVPYLRAVGIRGLTRLVVSHLDLDHSGGALSVLRSVAVEEVVSSLPDDHEIVRASRRHVPCRRGEGWHWGAVEFVWLHPDGEEAHGARRVRSNARSCVLQLRSPGGNVLFTGDVEAAQERTLLAAFGAQGLRSDVLIAPHPGSATSSTSAFLDAVGPRWAVFQVGYRNRFGHPDARVLARYEAGSISVLRTDALGAIRILLQPGAPPRIESAREDRPRYWRIRMSGSHDGPDPPDPPDPPDRPDRPDRPGRLGRPERPDQPDTLESPAPPHAAATTTP